MSKLPLLPRATLGVLGGGQLGRYFVLAARRLGYTTIVLDPQKDCPAGQVADAQIIADYADEAALRSLGGQCAAVTCEFENVPAASLRLLATLCRVAPSAEAVSVAQDRILEKKFLSETGLKVAPYQVIEKLEDLASAKLFPGILKRARYGYDGKGQATVTNPGELAAAWQDMQYAPCVLEARLPLDKEISVVLARGDDGQVALFPVAENQHVKGILDLTVAPAQISAALASQACEAATRIAQRLDYVGVLAVEFFISGGELVVNEIAPRPHNSGHYTLDACDTSQFDQQLRTLAGLRLPQPRQLAGAAMVNLLGHSWKPEPPWETLLSQAGAKLHLYGKHEARQGRKMGHITFLDSSAKRASEQANACRILLGSDT